MTRSTRRVALSLAGVVAVGLFAWSPSRAPRQQAHVLPDAVLNAVVEPELVSSAPLPDESGWTCLLPEQTVYAASREEALLARSAPAPGGRTIDADRPPVRTIMDNRATYSAIAVDPKRDEVVLQDENLYQILVYGRHDNTPPTASMTEPKRRIGGLKTKVEFNCGLYIDPGSGDIYSVPNDTVDKLVIFGRQAEGDVVFSRPWRPRFSPGISRTRSPRAPSIPGRCPSPGVPT